MWTYCVAEEVRGTDGVLGEASTVLPLSGDIMRLSGNSSRPLELPAADCAKPLTTSLGVRQAYSTAVIVEASSCRPGQLSNHHCPAQAAELDRPTWDHNHKD